ncbi:DUF6161 domain-containing protein [Flavobacterium psychrophilum]|uniref:DUF6161 domain-containing protein n=1 Tax=Flavobacterium psychrophilum TaxID=96345 RepID=UPI0028A3F6A6|nr:hypothetical protein [Flavobacterium psychrophilum]
MINSEFKKKILEAQEIEWFQNVSVSFNFGYVNYYETKNGLSAIYEFVNQQINGWEKYENLPSELKYSLNYFNGIKNNILQFVNSYINQPSNDLNSYFQSTKSEIENVNQKPLPYHIPQVEFLIKVSKESPNYFPGAYNFILETNNYNVNNRENFYGALLAYEFTLKDHTQLSERRKAEQSSISKIRNDFQKYLSESEIELVKHLKNANDNFSEYSKKIDDLKTEKEEIFENWFNNTKNEEWQKWYDEKVNLLSKLEETYEKKLKLDKPARYWEKKSTKYYEQGKKARVILIWIVVCTSIFLGLILTISPNWIFTNVFKGNEISIVRWSIVFITLLSLIAFSIKALAKYMFSSFHLARDAEERHTLTFFYLALSKDSQVGDEDRKMILQALFSRTETGLLKEDSSPTLPTNDVINKFINK